MRGWWVDKKVRTGLDKGASQCGDVRRRRRAAFALNGHGHTPAARRIRSSDPVSLEMLYLFIETCATIAIDTV